MSDQLKQGDVQKAGDLGWGLGAMKLGNADGVKAPTAVDREKGNICYTQG